MDLKTSIPKFLKTKLLENKLSLKEFSSLNNIHYITVLNMYSGHKLKPDLNTILKIADFFKCSIDEVVGRNPKYFFPINIIQIFTNLDKNTISNNIKLFIAEQILKQNTTLDRLSINMDFHRGFLNNFMKEDKSIKSLSTLSVCKIAEYFDISIDEMIGRVCLNNTKPEVSSSSESTTNN